MLSIFGYLHILRSLGISDMTPLQKKHKMEMPTMVKKKKNIINGNEIQVPLEDKNAIDNG
jgi:hypothetical protein